MKNTTHLLVGPIDLALIGLFLLAIGAAATPAVGQGNAEQHMMQMVNQLQEMNQADGYLEAHRGVEQPLELLGGPVDFSVTQRSGGVFVGLPANREIDSNVLGTPEMPLAFTGTPGITGVPPAPAFRGVENGEYTTIQRKTPFGDEHIVLPNGTMTLQAVDRTATDAATTQDEVQFQASWEDESGNTYEVRCCEMLAAAGVEFPTFGGVVTNHLLHGFSGVGTPLMPTEFTYAAFWGMGEVRKNGEVTDKPRIVHGMLTEYVRTEGYELASDAEVTPTRRHFHLMVAPFMPVQGEHKFEHQNVSTGFMLPNGMELPFWHVMFENLDINSSRGD